jgi:hypothetical protein
MQPKGMAKVTMTKMLIFQFRARLGNQPQGTYSPKMRDDHDKLDKSKPKADYPKCTAFGSEGHLDF